jgi:hypothetical protein
VKRTKGRYETMKMGRRPNTSLKGAQAVPASHQPKYVDTRMNHSPRGPVANPRTSAVRHQLEIHRRSFHSDLQSEMPAVRSSRLPLKYTIIGGIPPAKMDDPNPTPASSSALRPIHALEELTEGDDRYVRCDAPPPPSAPAHRVLSVAW